MSVSNPSASLKNNLQTPPKIDEKVNEEENKLWYYLDRDHQQMGPVSVIALRELWNRGELEMNQYVWSSGMDKWEKVEDLSELQNALNQHSG